MTGCVAFSIVIDDMKREREREKKKQKLKRENFIKKFVSIREVKCR
jgi:hypothetical protein